MKTFFHGLLPAAIVAVPCLRRYESMTLVKAGKTFLNGPGRRGKEQTETCPILMEQAPLQTRFGNDALLLGEKNCFFPKSQRPEKDCRGSKRLPAKLLLSGTAYFENSPAAVKGPGASTALINAPLQMTHHWLSARCVKEQLRRPCSYSEGPLSNVHDHGT